MNGFGEEEQLRTLVLPIINPYEDRHVFTPCGILRLRHVPLRESNCQHRHYEDACRTQNVNTVTFFAESYHAVSQIGAPTVWHSMKNLEARLVSCCRLRFIPVL
ncbi:hypothetical protein CEXT_83411 [Caerostris extrusa]|uniref:Uncharacterized protein n=1 Tax=Caerostris extrusa TaxID=172846 RepID=A0AAV4MAJ5_CAEEX|nr:hypothetical protein CEXT_83411 [Caerostris extrusa]